MTLRITQDFWPRGIMREMLDELEGRPKPFDQETDLTLETDQTLPPEQRKAAPKDG